MVSNNRSAQRRDGQMAFENSGENLLIGDEVNLPLPIETLSEIDENSSYVQKVFSSGLTALVYKLEVDGKYYNLKKKRKKILVSNVDGQTSFLNEIQRRQELEKAKEKNPDLYDGIVDTIYANYRAGFMISPWIEGEEASFYNRDIFRHLFKTLIAMEYIGIFEYDPTAGNIIIHKDKIKLFDFGYAYRFNPLVDLNPEGFHEPIFHVIERFESRAFMMHLYEVERLCGKNTALKLYQVEKEEAINAYKDKLTWLQKMNASNKVIGFYSNIINHWQDSLNHKEQLEALYTSDRFRSFVIDVVDDISGKSCTPDTLIKVEYLLETIREKYHLIKDNEVLSWCHENLSKESLIALYEEKTRLVKQYQLTHLEDFDLWQQSRQELIITYYKD